MKDFLFVVGPVLEGDVDLFLQPEVGEDAEHLPESACIFDVLVKAGLFPSKAQARKNWSRSAEEIPPGYTEFRRVGKLKHNIFILKSF